jgi:hypothetical protein
MTITPTLFHQATNNVQGAQDVFNASQALVSLILFAKSKPE